MEQVFPSAMPYDMDTSGKRVRWALYELRRQKAAWLAKNLGISRSAVSQWWSDRNPSTPRDHISKIANLLAVNEKWLSDGEGSPESRNITSQLTGGSVQYRTETAPIKNDILTLGEVGAGMWLAVDELNDINASSEPSAYPPDLRYPINSQYDLIVRGTSINCFAGDGERVRCVALGELDLVSGDYVHVERYRNQRSEVENTIKRAFYVNGRWELRFHSTDLRWQGQTALILGSGENEQVEIKGIAIYQFRASPTRSRSS